MRPAIFLYKDAIKAIGRGRYPQNQKMGPHYNYSAFNSVHKFRPSKLADFEPDFNSVILSKGVRLTDNISSTPIPWYVLIISEKLLDIFTSFKLPPHKIYPNVPIIHGVTNVSGYCALHILDLPEYIDFINYEKSVLWIQEMITHRKVERLKLRDREDLNSIEEEVRIKDKDRGPNDHLLQVWAEVLVMKDEFFDMFDIFALSSVTFPVNFKVTERLKTAIEAENITGIEFVRLEKGAGDKLAEYSAFE